MTSRAIVAAAVAVLAFAAACGGGDEDRSTLSGVSGRVETLSAAGGRATLSIPVGALPDGVTADSITITEEDVAETDIRVDDVPPDAVFLLEPSGLVFAEPVTLTLRVPIEGLLREYPLPLLLLGQRGRRRASR